MMLRDLRNRELITKQISVGLPTPNCSHSACRRGKVRRAISGSSNLFLGLSHEL